MKRLYLLPIFIFICIFISFIFYFPSFIKEVQKDSSTKHEKATKLLKSVKHGVKHYVRKYLFLSINLSLSIPISNHPCLIFPNWLTGIPKTHYPMASRLLSAIHAAWSTHWWCCEMPYSVRVQYTEVFGFIDIHQSIYVFRVFNLPTCTISLYSRNIRFNEFLNQNWFLSDKENKAPNLIQLIRWFQQVFTTSLNLLSLLTFSIFAIL